MLAVIRGAHETTISPHGDCFDHRARAAGNRNRRCPRLITRAIAEYSCTPLAQPASADYRAGRLRPRTADSVEACAGAAYTAFKVGEMEDLSWQAALNEYLRISMR